MAVHSYNYLCIETIPRINDFIWEAKVFYIPFASCFLQFPFMSLVLPVSWLQLFPVCLLQVIISMNTIIKLPHFLFFPAMLAALVCTPPTPTLSHPPLCQGHWAWHWGWCCPAPGGQLWTECRDRLFQFWGGAEGSNLHWHVHCLLNCQRWGFTRPYLPLTSLSTNLTIFSAISTMPQSL